MFDFDATLPLMAVQFLLLTALLNAVFYKPLTKVLDERDEFIRGGATGSKEKLAKAESIVKEYERQIAQARREAQNLVQTAQAEAKEITASKIAQAQQEVQSQRETASQEIEQQKAAALANLEQQVDSLSSQILEKILDPALIK
ncbi:H+-transporting two-sector ATPase subunit B/B' [Chondrocystis sp. NIES-4102]|nr:H+-transporting two-sector ATPase subunit B/B' [Chondrocystis sp. NIES-4102]